MVMFETNLNPICVFEANFKISVHVSKRMISNIANKVSTSFANSSERESPQVWAWSFNVQVHSIVLYIKCAISCCISYPFADKHIKVVYRIIFNERNTKHIFSQLFTCMETFCCWISFNLLVLGMRK